MSLQKLLTEIIDKWPDAVNENFAGHPIARLIRNDLKSEVLRIVEGRFPNYLVKSSAGAGNWANVPWLTILNPEITKTTEDGFYPVYLFKAGGGGVYLSLNQGTTAPIRELGNTEAREKAKKNKENIISYVPSLLEWGETTISLNASTKLSKTYEEFNIVGKVYLKGSIPPDNVLEKDLLDLMSVYENIANNWSLINSDMKKEQKNITTTYSIQLPKPFLLLAGVSGTGKTRFVREQASRFNTNLENYCLVAVRPDWHEPSDLLGYISRLGGNGARYITTDFLRFLVAAWKHIEDQSSNGEQAIPYWLCLDEMNLAPVEQYFADYLSIIETRCWKDGEYQSDAILSSGVFKDLDGAGRDLLRADLDLDDSQYTDLWSRFLENGISIPSNLIVAGTVNMDETTHGFSRKVIDRAFTLDFGEFFPNNYTEFFNPKTQPVTLSYPIISQAALDDLSRVQADSDGQKSIGFLAEINNKLRQTPFELAFRALNELLIAVANNQPRDEVALQSVWDDFLMTKVLPRIEGDAEKLRDDGDTSLLKELEILLSKVLSEIWDKQTRIDLLREDIAGEALTIACRSQKKIAWMRERLESNGFTSFWP